LQERGRDLRAIDALFATEEFAPTVMSKRRTNARFAAQ
jgi:hypothetical protein